MTLEGGQDLLHYRLIEKLGQGGMGVVWRARDRRLRRDVALKLLPPDVVQTTERRHRFLREARAAAAISHPHIATVFEVGEAEGHAFIAMELVKGQSLRQKTGKRPLPLSEVLSIACQVTDGLTHAHEAGVIHRDLKPDNIMVGRDGYARILDFGLAKLREDHERSPLELSQMSTISDEMTRVGKVFGTAAYMSPEQARGGTIDERSDVFSFGATLFEIATGHLPFRGATPLDTMTAVLQQEPPVPSSLNPEIPPELERIIRKSLQKAPEDRYQDTRDLLLDLRQLKRDTDSQPLVRASSERGSGTTSRDGRLAWILATIGLAALVGLGTWALTVGPWAPAPSTKEIQQRLLTTNPVHDPILAAAISPDGRTLVYYKEDGTYLQILETGEVKRIIAPNEGSEVGASGWYPDSLRLLVTLDSESPRPSMWIYSIVTGAMQKLRDAASGPGMFGAVSPDGRTIAFVPADGEEEIWLMNADGTDPRRVVALEDNDTTVNWWVRWSPDSQRILYRRQTGFGDEVKNSIESCDLQGGARTQIVAPILHVYPGIHAEWVPDGRVIFSQTEPAGRLRDNNLWEVDVDLRTGRPRSEPRRLTSWVGFFSYYLTATRQGELVIVRWRTQTETYLMDLHPSGESLLPPRLVGSDAMDDFPVAWLDQGRALLIASNRRKTDDIYWFDLQTETARPLVATDAEELPLTVSPDGQWILYSVLPNARRVAVNAPGDLMRVSIDGGVPERVDQITRISVVRCSSEVGGPCVLAEWKEGGVRVEELDPFAGRGRLLLELPKGVGGIELSPDGRFLVWRYDSEDGPAELVLEELSTSERKVLDLGSWSLRGAPTWDPGGQHVLAIGELDSRWALMKIALSGELSPLWLSDGDAAGGRRVIPSPDGRRFAFSRGVRESNVWALEGY